MDPLASIFFSPGAAGSIANAAKSAASAVAQPFAEMLSALTSSEESSDSGDESGDAAQSLEERIAERLQEVLEFVGAESGDEATVQFDPETDEVRVLTPASWGDAAGVEISTDGELMDALRALAAADGSSDPLELLVEVG